MNGWIIYREEDRQINQRAIRLFQEAGERHGVPVNLKIHGPDLMKKRSESLPDFVINRSRDHFLGKWFEQKGIRVFNSSEVTRICNDKSLTLELAQNLGVPVLPWVLAEESGMEEGWTRYPVVAKSCDGHGGKEVFLAENSEKLGRIRRIMDGKKWMLQKLASEPGKDLRVYVLGGRIVKAMLRCSDTDFRSNYSLGGTVREYELSGEEQRVIRSLTEVLKPDYAGIDFLFHEGHPVLNEIEDAVGARMLYTHTNLDIISEYMSYIWEQMRQRAERGT